MSKVSVTLPQSLHEHLKEVARREGISASQFIVTAVAEKLASLDTAAYLEERARRGSREKLLRVLAKAPDVEPPEERDRL